MAGYSPTAIPAHTMHEQNMRALEKYREIDLPMCEGFYSTDLAQIRFVDLTKGPDDRIDLNDFRGRIQPGRGILTSGQSPFHADRTRLTIVKWGPEPEQCGKIILDNSSGLSECSIVSYVEVRVEAGVMFGPGAIIMDCDGSPVDPAKPRGIENLEMAPVLIEHTAWIGAHAFLMPGARIGHHSTVSTAAVVSGEVPPHCVVAGNPARIVARFQ